MNIDIEAYIRQQLEEIDIAELVRREIRTIVNGELRSGIVASARKEVDAIIKTEIEACLTKPVKTDDGWGKKAEYESLDDLFKQEFRKKLDSNYEMKNTIKKIVESKVSDLMKERYYTIAKRVADELIATAA